MKGKVLILALLSCCCTLVSCDSLDLPGMFWSQSDTVDDRFAQSMAYNDQNGYATVHSDTDEYSVYVFTDFHTDGDTRNLDALVKTYESAPAPLSLYLGDVVNNRDADWDLFIKATSPLSEQGDLFVTPGNHDLYFGLWPEYLSYFHTASYWFEVLTPGAKDLFICLDSGSGTLGKSQRYWLEVLLASKASQYRHVIVFTHTHFFKIDASQGHTSNYAMEETYDLAHLFTEYGVSLVLTGHDHTMEDTTFGAVRYIIVPSLENSNPNAGYAVCSVGTSISVDFRTL